MRSLPIYLVATCSLLAIPAMAQSRDAPASIRWSDDPPAQAQVRPVAPRELQALVAPIALFPDVLLANVLMASTYPLDVVGAARWLNDPANAALSGEALIQALDAQGWDPSVKALTAAPEVLRMMDGRLDWMQSLGRAFAADQSAVMDAVQDLRRQAKAAGTLVSDSHRRVIDQDGQIIIEPASTQAVYVDLYDPFRAFGTWASHDYPPVTFASPQDTVFPTYAYAVPLIGPLWGWSTWDWRNRRIHIDMHRWHDLDHNRDHDRPQVNVGATWQHDPGLSGAVQFGAPNSADNPAGRLPVGHAPFVDVARDGAHAKPAPSQVLATPTAESAPSALTPRTMTPHIVPQTGLPITPSPHPVISVMPAPAAAPHPAAVQPTAVTPVTPAAPAPPHG